MKFGEWGHSAFTQTASSSKGLTAPSSCVLPEESRRSLASPQLLTEVSFQLKENRVIGIVSVSRSTCQLHPLPSRAMDSLGQCVSVEGCEWDALEWDVVQSASQLSSLPGLPGSCAAKVQGSRSQSTFYLCQVLAAAPPESMCSAPFNHTCQPQGPRPSHCHMCLAEPGIVLAGLCSSTEAAWTFS